MASGTTLQSTPAKSIYVYRNGDTNFQCKKVVVNPRQVKNWDSFIELVTARVKARNGGAVRRVFTPTGRNTISDLGGIENNHFYVAAGAEGFKRHQYNQITTLTPQKTRLSLPPIIRPVKHSRLKVSARCKRAAVAVGSKVIYVFRNGDANSPAVKILFTKFMLKNYDVVLNEVTRKVNIMTGAVWKLHSLDGRQLQGPEEFEDHEFYVASGRENFKKVPYPKDGVIVSPRVLRPALVKRRITRLSKDSKASKASKESKESKPAQTEQKKPKPSKPSKPSQASKPSQPTPPKIKKEKSPEQKEAEEVFHHKPTMVKRSRERDQPKENALDYSDDPEGVFKAKEERNETKGAAEVQETVETAIDLPIDQVAAEEVEEEEDLDVGDNEDTQEPANEDPKPEPPKESVDLVGRMLENDEVPEAIPDDAPPTVDEDENVVVNDGDDEGGDVGVGDDVGNGTQEEKAGGGAKEEKNEEDQNDENPVSPPASNGRAQSPNENNNNSAENRDVPPENRDDQVIETAGSPAPSVKPESLPPLSTTKSNGRVETPFENNKKSALSRKSSSQRREGQSRISPHPPATKRSVPPSPASSNRRSVTPKEIISNDVESRPQSHSREVPDSAPSPQAPPSPAVQNGQAQPPVENNTPRPVSGDGQPPSRGGQIVEATVSPQPLPSEQNAAPSPDVENGQAQSPVQNVSPRPVSGGGQNVEATLTPHPQPSEQNVPPSPAASNAQAQSPIQNVSPRPVSGGDQVVDSAPSPHPPASERNPTPTASTGPAQSPIKDTSSRPESTHAPPESNVAQGATASPNPPPSEPNKPTSPMGDTEPSQSPVNQDTPLANTDEQAIDSADSKDNVASLPQKDVDNAVDAEPREGQVAA